MRTLIALCLLALMAAPAAAAEYVVGDLAITYDPAQWSFQRVQVRDPLVSRADSYWATCAACRGDEARVVISVRDVAVEESPSVLDPMWSRDRRESARTVGEITFSITTIFSPCRNYVPPSITATAVYKGRTYRLHSGVVVGCRGATIGVGHERFEELVRGFHPREG